MASDSIKDLKEKLAQKEEELEVFRTEISHLNKNLQTLIEKIQTQVKSATKIQEILLPTEIPNIPGFEFSTKFVPSYQGGGDYFDIFELEDRFRFGMILASSSGHGISALFLSILLKLTGQIEAKRGIPPDKVIQQISNELVSQVKGEEYANIFYSVIDRRSFEIHYCNVGSNEAFHYKFAEKEVVALTQKSTPLSSDKSLKFQLQTTSLNPRDFLVIISEGVANTQNLEGEVFGSKRIENIIFEKAQSSPHEIRNEILFQIQKFRNSKDLKKDATVIVAEVKDRVLKLAK